MAKIPNIARSTSYLTLALIIQKIVSFSYFIILTRALGLEVMGQYYTAISFTTIFGIFIDLGLANALTREVAKRQDQAAIWLGNVITLKIPLALLTFLISLGIAQLLGYHHIVFQLIFISSISMVLDSFTSTFFAVMRGFHSLKYESIASVLFQLIVLVLGWTAIYLNYDVRVAIGALAVASVFNFLYSSITLRKRIGLKWRLLWDKPFVRQIFAISWPFGLFAIFQRLYLYLDSVLLSNLSDFHQVGVYQIAFKIINALQFLPLAFTASLYPAMSTYWLNDKKQLNVSFERALNYLIIISVPIIAGVFALDEAILNIFKAGPEALWPLRISILSLFFIFVNYPIGSLLNATNRQKKNLLFISIVTTTSIALNFILIPRWGALGASITVLFTNTLMFFLGVSEINRIIQYNFRRNLIMFAKVLWSAAVMGTIVYYGRNFMPLWVATALGGSLYFVILYLVGGFTKQDIFSIYRSFNKR